MGSVAFWKKPRVRLFSHFSEIAGCPKYQWICNVLHSQEVGSIKRFRGVVGNAHPAWYRYFVGFLGGDDRTCKNCCVSYGFRGVRERAPGQIVFLHFNENGNMLCSPRNTACVAFSRNVRM